jgi:hypothetical protein
LWGSDGNSYYWSDGGDILQPYQTEPHVEGDGGSVLFWGCITANGPGYGTTVMDGSVNSTVYVDIFLSIKFFCLLINYNFFNAKHHYVLYVKYWERYAYSKFEALILIWSLVHRCFFRKSIYLYFT